MKKVNCRKVAENACKNWFSYQNAVELELAARAVKNFDPKVILEIGVANGASLATWAAVTEPDLVIGLDPLTNPKTPEAEASLNQLIKDYNIQMIPHIDRAREAHEKLEKILGNRKIDFMFIDGGHGYNDASYDFQFYSQYLNVPSIVGFHDVYGSDALADGGSLVNFYWDRVARQSGYNYDLFHNHSSMGIGIIYINKDNAPELIKENFTWKAERDLKNES